jgi:hypothetical protein
MAIYCMDAGITQRFVDGVCKLVFCPWDIAVVRVKLRFVFFYNASGKLILDHITMRESDESGFELLRGDVNKSAEALLKSWDGWESDLKLADQQEKKKISELMGEA